MQFFTIGPPDCVPIHSIEICQFVIYTIWKEKKIFFPIGHPGRVPINSIETSRVPTYTTRTH